MKVQVCAFFGCSCDITHIFFQCYYMCSYVEHVFLLRVHVIEREREKNIYVVFFVKFIHWSCFKEICIAVSLRKKKEKVVAKIFIYRIYKEFLMKVYFIQVPSKIYVHVNKVYRV